jgi:hypothetical protein
MTTSTRASSSTPLKPEHTTAQMLVEMHLQAAARWNAAAEDANRELDGAQVITCRAHAAAAAVLAGISLPVDAQILDVSWARETLIVAYRQPSSIAFEFAVDAYRLPAPDETDVDQVDPRAPGEWILTDQLGDHGADGIDRMIRDAIAHLDEAGVTAGQAADALPAALYA